MARRHDHGVVVGGQRDLVKNTAEIADDDLMRRGEMCGACQLRAVIVHRDLKADIVQHRGEGAADMARAEEVDAPRADDGLDKGAAVPVGSGGKEALRAVAQLVRCKEAKFAQRLAVEHEAEPYVSAAAERVAPGAQHSDLRGVLRRNILEPNRHVAAADHARAVRRLRVECKVPQGVPFPLQQLAREENGLPLHRAAADRAERCAVGKDRHVCARAARGGAVGLQDAAEHHALTARQSGKHCV